MPLIWSEPDDAAQMREEEAMTTDLIPTNGVHIVETYYPKGFSVARYDREGFSADGRWFETREKAEAYAAKISK